MVILLTQQILWPLSSFENRHVWGGELGFLDGHFWTQKLIFWLFFASVWSTYQNGLMINWLPMLYHTYFYAENPIYRGGVLGWKLINFMLKKSPFNQVSIKVQSKLLQHSVGQKLWPLQWFKDRHVFFGDFFRFSPINQSYTKKFPKKTLPHFTMTQTQLLKLSKQCNLSVKKLALFLKK